MNIEEKLKELGVDLPEAKAPVANYASHTKSGHLIFISGQISQIKGKIGKDIDTEHGYQAAREAALALLAQLRVACAGDFSKVKSCLKLGVFVNSTDDYIQQPQIANGASDLISEVMGKHARAAVSCNSLPLGVAVEVEGLFEVE